MTHQEPPTLTVVTVTDSGADIPLSPETVNEHVPAASPVTVKGPVPEVGDTVATALQEVDPLAAVVTVKFPLALL
jgi:hypothetical protein